MDPKTGWSIRRSLVSLASLVLVTLVVGYSVLRTVWAAQGDQAGGSVSATILISSETPHILPEAPNDSEGSPEKLRTFRKTQVALIKNARILQHALNRPEVSRLEVVRQQADPLSWIQRTLEFELPEDSEVLRISMSGPRARELAIVVNSVINAYMLLVVEEQQRARVTRLEMLKKLLRRYEDDLLLKRKEIRQLATAVGLPGVPLPPREERLSALLKQLQGIRLEKVAAEVILERAKSDKATGDSSRSALAAQEERLAVLRGQEKLLEDQKQQLLGESIVHLDVDNLRMEIEVTEQMARRVALAVENLEVELNAPARIRLLSPAT